VMERSTGSGECVGMVLCPTMLLNIFEYGSLRESWTWMNREGGGWNFQAWLFCLSMILNVLILASQRGIFLVRRFLKTT